MNSMANIPSAALPFPAGFEVSWAGPNPFGDGFCLGSEDGGLQFFDKHSRPFGQVMKVSPSSEAINSVAGVGTWLAISTRKEISFIGKASAEGTPLGYGVPFGAHQLALTPSGYFVAALGRSGLLFAAADITKENFIVTNPGAEEEHCAYRLLTLAGDARHDLIVLAGRTGGISYGQWHALEATTNMRTMTFAGLDVVDICSIGSIEHPRAVAALGRDGSLILARDIVSAETPDTIKFVFVADTAYRIVRCRGHLFVLTSEGLIGLWNLAENFVKGTLPGNGETSLLRMPMKAIEINVVMAHWLLIVGLDSIIQVDVDLIHDDAGADGMEKYQPQILAPNWKSRGVMQTAREFALTA